MNSAWLAGFVDGEGCIGLSPVPYGGWQVRIIITNTSEDILKQIHSQYGGTMSARQYKPNWKPCRQLTLCSRKAIVLLRDIYPFLVLKRPQANIAFEFQSLLGKGERIPITVVQKKQVLADTLHRLNKKGVGN